MKNKLQMSCMAMLAAATMSGSFSSCSNDDLADANSNKLPENAIAFNVTQQGALSRGTETNSGNFSESYSGLSGMGLLRQVCYRNRCNSRWLVCR